MNVMTDIILPAGQSGMNLVLFIFLPVMVVMLTAMRLLELTGSSTGWWRGWRRPCTPSA